MINLVNQFYANTEICWTNLWEKIMDNIAANRVS